ncbi:MAG TPA: hypothetical protein VJ850_08820 [Candidatus Limnocylindrales bacterium]|nr:hypothetical protein [Candidatus Limnocylindrales bacterium]
MGRRFSGARVALLAAALGVAAAGCGSGQPANPYVTLDRAISVGWQQVMLNLGVSIDVPAQQIDQGFSTNPTSIHIDPSMLQATVDTQTGRWQVATSIPLAALGVTPQQVGPFGLAFQSVDVQVLFDGTAVYAKSPLLPLLLQGGLGGGAPIDGDLTGWVKLGTAAELAKVTDQGMLPGLFGFGAIGGAAGGLPLPSAGSPEALQSIVEDFGIALAAAGRESTDGLETDHLTATLNLAKLAESRTLATMTGMGKDQLQGVFDAAKQVTVTADLWADVSSGRARTIRLDFRTLSAPITTITVVLQLKEPAAGTTFDAPATFTDVPLLQLMNQQVNGIVDEVGTEVPPEETIETLVP